MKKGLLLVAVAMLAGCHDQDDRIEREVKEVLRAEGQAQVEVHVDDRRVRLRGNVSSMPVRNRLEGAVGAIDGVRWVDNELVVPLTAATPAEELASTVRRRLVEHGFTSVMVSVNPDGVVTLKGAVDRDKRDEVVRLAREASPDVRRVDESLMFR